MAPDEQLDAADGASVSSDAMRLASIEARLAQLEARSGRLSWWRILAFLVCMAGLCGIGSSLFYPFLVSLPAAVLFIAVLLRHGDVLDQIASLENDRLLLSESSERRESRRSRSQAPTVDTSIENDLAQGQRVYAPEPPSFELDDGLVDDFNLLTGVRSLFGFLNTCSTSFGARRLRYWLTHPLTKSADILTRQDAVREAAQKSDARTALLKSLLTLRKRSYDSAPTLLHASATFTERGGLRVLTHVMGTLPAIIVILLAFGIGGFALAPPLLLLVVCNMAIIGINVKYSNPARDRLLLFRPLLQGLVAFHSSLERASFEAAEWQRIAGTFCALRPTAKQLLRVLSFLALHSYGVLFEIFNVLTLWELRWIPIGERVLESHRRELEHALGALGESEALLSLACPLAEQDGFCLPEPLESDRPSLSAEALGHPSIESDSVVRNPLQLNSERNVWIITGSNMAGKSTYLKAVGVNLVLAGAGGPVSAQSFRWTPLTLYSDVNVRDSLDEHKSYFQVEVERVLHIVHAANAKPMVFAIFDELFRGTNSEERYAISRAILRYLRSCGALVIAATHDLALTKLVEEDNEPGMENRHLREKVSGRAMTFDYRLREGPAPTRNAIRVLEASGYPEELTKEARESCQRTDSDASE